MVTIPSLEELLNKGVHFGHKTSKRYPKANSYIYTERNGIHIIDLTKTVQGLKEALDYVEKTVKAGGVILFVGSKKQARTIVEKAATDCGMPYIVGRWLGGTFTNFENIVKLTRRLDKLIKDEESGAWGVYTKKEQVTLRKEKEKLLETVGGISNMKKLPQAVFVIDIKKEKTAVAEANKVGIPIIALVDTNVNPDLVEYPIPANDDAIKSIEEIAGLVSQTVQEAKKATILKNK